MRRRVAPIEGANPAPGVALHARLRHSLTRGRQLGQRGAYASILGAPNVVVVACLTAIVAVGRMPA